jgi:phosphomannomutase
MKLKLKPDPTFEVSVKIPVPGHGTVDMVWKFNHKDRKQLEELQSATNRDVEDHKYLMMIACGWGLDESFTEENVKIFVDSYHGSVKNIVDTYFQELGGNKAKN